MRILGVLRARTWGGSSGSLADVLNHWATSHTVWLATADDEADAHAPELDAGIDVVSLGHPASTALKIGSQLPVVRSLRRSIRDLKPDVLLSWGTWANLITIPARAGLGVPLIISERVDPRERGSAMRQAFWALVYRAARPEGFVVPTRDLADWARRTVPADRVQAIPNVAPIATARHAEETSGSRVVVAAGRLVHQKGFDLLVQAFALCAAERPDWRLRILGEGEDRSKLETLARELRIADRVDLPGFTPDLAGEFGRAAFFVLSSRFEGFGRVLTECLAAGLPAVAFDCRTGPREIIRHEVDGLLVPPEDVAALAAAMARLMDDAVLRSTMAARAPEVVERFGADRIFSLWDALLRSVTA
jgi:GalNAc-alpha-(1->4)-GalNAc-alpha-(1->3)-diNAcBac-PP-undecaprenol alpha-1,4-N-acetyl-D-galactosaminyltransferase